MTRNDKDTDRQAAATEANDDERDVAFHGFATASPVQLLRLRNKHAGATTNMTMNDEDKEDTGEYDRDMRSAYAAKRSLWTDLFNMVKGLFWSSSEYDDLGSKRFRHCLGCTSRQFHFKWTDVQQRTDAAAARAKEQPGADNFMAFERARLQRKIVATEIVMAHAAREGKTGEYNRARTAHDEFVGYDANMQSIMERMGTLSESEKADLMSQAFPQEWSQYQNGELAIDRPPGGRAYGEVRQAASRDGIEQPFIQTLKDLFAAAGRFLTGDSSQPADQSQTVQSRPQPVNG